MSTFTLVRGAAKVAALSVAAAVASVTPASLIVVSDQSLFTALVGSQGGDEVAVSFADYHGYYASGLAGGSGDAAWVANAAGGLYASGGMFSTNISGAALSMSFADSDVFAIGGEFFNTDMDFNVISGFMKVEVDGLAYVFNTHGLSNNFVGFVSTTGEIHNITISIFGSATSSFVTTGSMAVGVVPAPGVIALAALGGIVTGRRRRT
jgi:hypothetical protein